MTEKIDIEEARIAVRSKLEQEKGDPFWNALCAQVLDGACLAASNLADGTWDDLGRMLDAAGRFDEGGDNALAGLIDAWAAGLEPRDAVETAPWRDAFARAVSSASPDTFTHCAQIVRSELASVAAGR